MKPIGPPTTPAQQAATKGGNGSNGDLTGEERRRVIAQLRRNWLDEMRSAELYRRLAATQPGGDASRLLLEMSGHEVQHAGHWQDRLQELGSGTGSARVGIRQLLLPALARIAGLGTVISLIEAGEAQGIRDYIRQSRELPDEASRQIAAGMVPQERHHQDIAARLRLEATAAGETGSRLAKAHMGDFIRDLIFGLNDGLVSNFSLIAGVSGAGTSRHVVLLAGVAGLLAGAVSMAAGSYLSNKAQREVVDAEVRRRREELLLAPEEEREQLRRIYLRKGFSEEEVEILVRRVSADQENWLEVLVTEELGMNLQPGPPPALDAGFTGGGFAVGAVVPLVPFIVAGGTGPLVIAGALSIAALFAVGASKSIFTARGAVRSGMEMVVVGVIAAAFTNLVGRLFGGQTVS